MPAWSANSDEGILIIDLAGTICELNPRLQELLKLHTVPGTVAALLRQVEGANPELAGVLAGMNAEAYETQWGNLRIQHYPPRHLTWQRIPLLDGDQLAGTLVIFREIGGQGHPEQEKQSFLSMISHDLRTPLSAILGFAELLYNNRGKLDDDEQAEFLEHIIQNANDLTRYTQIALDIMYLEANAQNFESEAVFVNRFVKHWLSDALHRLPVERIEFHNGIEGDPMALVAPSALHRILYILAEFALAESPVNQPVGLRLSFDQSQAHIMLQHQAPRLGADDARTLFQLMNPRDLSEAGRPVLHRMQLYVASLLAERQQGYLALRDQGGQRYELDLAMPLASTS